MVVVPMTRPDVRHAAVAPRFARDFHGVFTVAEVPFPATPTRAGALWARWQTPTTVLLAVSTAGTAVLLDGSAQIVAPSLLGLAGSLVALVRPERVDDVVEGRWPRWHQRRR